MTRLPTIAMVTFILAPQLVRADDDPGAAKHGAMLAAMSKKPCVPPAQVHVAKDTNNEYRLSLGVEASALVVCASRTTFGAPQDPFACWSVDPKTGALATRKPTLLAGTAYRVASACALGYCRPKQKPPAKAEDAPQDLLAISTDGSKVAIATGMNPDASSGMSLAIFDAKTKTFQREISLHDDKTGEGMGYEPADLVFVGDLVFVAGYAAGPAGDVWMFSASKGKPVGGVGPKDNAVNIYGGGYGLVDATHFRVSDGGYNEAIVDTTTAAVTMKSLPKPAACSQDDWERSMERDTLDDSSIKVAKKCSKALASAKAAFWKTSSAPSGFIRFDGKGFKLRHKKTAELLVLEANATKPKALTFPVCNVK